MWKELSELKDKKILIVGLGRTGVALAKFLTKHEAQVTVTDHKSRPELSSQLEQLESYTNIKFELGSHSPKTFLQQDLVVLSPGVSSHLKNSFPRELKRNHLRNHRQRFNDEYSA